MKPPSEDRRCTRSSPWISGPPWSRRVRAMLITLVLLSGAALMSAAWAPSDTQPASRPASAADQEYQQRFARLAPDDLKGHYALAEWCRQQQQYELLLRQAEYVLKLDPNFVNAKLLRTIALKELKAQERDHPGKSGAKPPEAEDEQARLRDWLISEQDIQKLRFAELRDLPTDDRRVPPDQRESVRARFRDNVLNDFLDAMAGEPEFTGKTNRREFLELPQTTQLQLIRRHKADAYGDRVEILSDPLVFRKFKRVLPMLEQGCGTTNCHGGQEPAKPFGFRTSHLATERSLYTNFVILDRVGTGKNRLINRTEPEDSLVLEYGLPERLAEKPHPTEIKPLFPQGPRDPKYRVVLDWIRALRIPAFRTGIKLNGYPEPPPPGAAIEREEPDKGEKEPKDKPVEKK